MNPAKSAMLRCGIALCEAAGDLGGLGLWAEQIVAACWRARLKALRTVASPAKAWSEAAALANLRMDFVRTNALDQTVRAVLGDTPPQGLAGRRFGWRSSAPAPWRTCTAPSVSPD